MPLPYSSLSILKESKTQEGRLTSPINSDIALVLAAYTIWKLLKGTRITPLADIPLVEALERAVQDQDQEEEYEGKVPRWRRVGGILWD